MAQKKNHYDRVPRTAGEVAANGLTVAIKLASGKLKRTVPEMERLLADHLQCNLHQLRYYARTDGLPNHFIDRAVRFFKMHDVPIAWYQLKPTKAILYTYGIEV